MADVSPNAIQCQASCPTAAACTSSSGQHNGQQDQQQLQVRQQHGHHLCQLGLCQAVQRLGPGGVQAVRLKRISGGLQRGTLGLTKTSNEEWTAHSI
jgi:hypothetical protein